MALDLLMKNGFRAKSFEYVGVLDLYFIHRYVIIKYRSSSIMDKIHLLLLELWPFVNVNDHALFMRIWQLRGHPCPMDTFLVIDSEPHLIATCKANLVSVPRLTIPIFRFTLQKKPSILLHIKYKMFCFLNYK